MKITEALLTEAIMHAEEYVHDEPVVPTGLPVWGIVLGKDGVATALDVIQGHRTIVEAYGMRQITYKRHAFDEYELVPLPSDTTDQAWAIRQTALLATGG